MTSHQSVSSRRQNADFFLNYLESYKELVGSLDTYEHIFKAVNGEISGIKSLIDLGNGGVFAYQPDLVEKITAVDLFLDALDPSTYPKNVVLKQGDATALSESDNTYDCALAVMLIHHLVGKNVRETEANLEKCIRECHRVLAPGGKLVIVESCVPELIYRLEKRLFPATNLLISTFLTHPMAYQYTYERITECIRSIFGNCEVAPVDKGKYVIQLGWSVPAYMTPVQPYLFTAFK